MASDQTLHLLRRGDTFASEVRRTGTGGAGRRHRHRKAMFLEIPTDDAVCEP